MPGLRERAGYRQTALRVRYTVTLYSKNMRAEVFTRRVRGCRLRPAEERAQDPLFGEITFFTVGSGDGGYSALSLTAIGNTTSTGNLLTLYEPVLVGLSTTWIGFRGFESFKNREGDTVSYVQEWRCNIG